MLCLQRSFSCGASERQLCYVMVSVLRNSSMRKRNSLVGRNAKGKVSSKKRSREWSGQRRLLGFLVAGFYLRLTLNVLKYSVRYFIYPPSNTPWILVNFC